MTTVNKGIKHEYRIRDQYKKEGYYVIRSAGSHGIIDLVAINPQTKVICLIQGKHPDIKLSKAQKHNILEELNHFSGHYTVIGELV